MGANAARPKVFVDVGAHEGFSIATVIEGGYAFDRMISAEPDPDMVAMLKARFAKELADGRYQISTAGISNKSGMATLFGDNLHGSATMLANKKVSGENRARTIELIDWPTFLDRFDLRDARLWVKINTEGAEVAIIESIIAEGGRNVESLVVYFDIVKVPFGAWKKWRTIRALRKSGIPFFIAEDILVKHAPRPRMHNWLSSFADLRDPPLEPTKPPLRKLVRMHYHDICSALGLRSSLFWKRR